MRHKEFHQVLMAHVDKPNIISYLDLPDNRLFSFEQQQSDEDSSDASSIYDLDLWNWNKQKKLKN